MDFKFQSKLIPLETRINKEVSITMTPSFISYSSRFTSEIVQMIKFLGLDGIKNDIGNSNLFSRGFEFNGLLLSTEYLNFLQTSDGFSLDKKIIEANLIREIPVLYSKIEINAPWPNTVDTNIQEKYLREHFDHIYILTTQREISQENKINYDSYDKTQLVHSLQNHPILNWKTQMSKTNRIKLQILNKTPSF